MKSRILSIIIWSMIAAAFIGPGTLTTASASGAAYKYQLLWALGFATIACIVIQEASARISIVNNKELPVVLMGVYTKSANTLKWLVGGSVIFGCAAYQAGNLLGSISGITLIYDIPAKPLIAALVLIVSILLYFGSYKNLAKVLSVLVGIMGISFLVLVFKADHNWSSVVSGIVPAIPDGAQWLVLGLVGTTIVPYNLFLGSGISRGQQINTMRWGLIISIGLGGLISIAILMTGSLITGEFSFQALSTTMQENLGSWAVYLLAFGLFAAGFTSSVTAPLAAGFISKGFFQGSNETRSFRMGWIIVMAVGFAIGMLNFKPVPVIIMAQALNGFILPVITVFLFIMINDPNVLGTKTNNVIQNLIYSAVMIAVVSIGLNNLASAISNIIDLGDYKTWIVLAGALIITSWSWWKVSRIKSVRA